jgi:uncharacterized protein
VKIEFDPIKSQKYTEERGLSFDSVKDFSWESAVTIRDNRYNYPELRLVSTGYLGNRIHVVCFTPIEGGVRVISLRKANSREIKRYAEKTTH